DAIERLLKTFSTDRHNGGRLRSFFARHSNDEIRSILAGTATDPLERDQPPGRVPHTLEALAMNLFSLFLKLEGKLVIVVGGGPIAEGKIEGLLSAGARVRIIAPQITQQIAEWTRFRKVEWLPKKFAAGDLEGATIVVAATSAAGVNK